MIYMQMYTNFMVSPNFSTCKVEKIQKKIWGRHCLENVEEGLPKLTFWVYDEESKHGIGTITLSIIQFQYDENLGYGLLINYLDNENGSNHYIDDLDDL